MANKINPSQLAGQQVNLTPTISKKIDELAASMKGFIWQINEFNLPAKEFDLVLNENAASVCSKLKTSFSVTPLPKEVSQKLEKTVAKINLGLVIVQQLKCNSTDSDPRLAKLEKRMPKIKERMKQGRIDLQELQMYADIVKASSHRNPDQKTKNLDASISESITEFRKIEAQRFEAQVKRFGESIWTQKTTPEFSDVLPILKNQIFALYFENILDLNDGKTYLHKFPHESVRPLFDKAVQNFCTPLTSHNCQQIAEGKHPIISCFPIMKKGEVYSGEFQALFSEMVSPLIRLQEANNLGTMGVWVQHETDCLALSITPDGRFGVFNPRQGRFDGCFQQFESIEEASKCLSSYLFEASGVIKNFSWTPLCNRILLEEPEERSYGEIRFRCDNVDPNKNVIFARGDDKSGLGGWGEDKATPLYFDPTSKEWVLSRRSNEGEFKLVLNNKVWEQGKNRDLSKPDPRPPRF